jgi:hypothetical protein
LQSGPRRPGAGSKRTLHEVDSSASRRPPGTLTWEKEDSPLNILLIALSYFTYCQLWIFVVLRGAWDDFILKREHHWVKTERFPVPKAG